MAKKIVGALVLLIAVFFVVVMTRPATFEIKRSLTINAPPEVVYAQVDNFKSWNAWSPWDKMDPTMKRTFNEVPAGVGAGYHWVGNKDVGEGSMKITDAKPVEHLGLDLDFIAPFEAHNRTSFDFVKDADGTAVTWTMSGTNNLMAKAMSVFMDMDKMVGPDFEKGLASLKAVSEAAAKEAVKPVEAVEQVAADAGTP